MGAEGEGTNSNHGGEDKGKEAEGSNNNNSNNGGKDKGEEKVLLWSGGPTCGVLDVLANGWNCEHGGNSLLFSLFLSSSFLNFSIPLFLLLFFFKI